MRHWPYLLLGLVNSWIISKWAGIEYTNAPSSIEWVYLSLARHYSEFGLATIWGKAQWFPWWYNGIPIENSYPPLLPVLTAALHRLSGASVGQAYHWATALLFVIGPWGVYALARRWSGNSFGSCVAALGYSCFSACAWVMPTIARDLDSYWLIQRVNVLARYGEGPHLAALGLLPWAWWAMDRAIEQRSWRRIAVAALLATMVAWSNVLGLMVLVWGALAFAAATGAWALVLAIGAWSALLGLRFVNWWFLEDIRRNAPSVGGAFPMGWPQYGALLALAGAVLWIGLIVRRRRGNPSFAVALGLALPMTVIPLAWEFASFHIVPQPHRYHLEMEMLWWLLAAFALAKLNRYCAGAALLAMLSFAFVAGKDYDRWVLAWDWKQSYLARVTQALREYDPEARVYLTGGAQFSQGMEAWQPQSGGGFANGIRLKAQHVEHYGTFAGVNNFEDTRDWLVAHGVDIVLVNSPDSENGFGGWNDPAKMAGKLPEIWAEAKDRAYLVERWNHSLAHVIPGDRIMRSTPVAFYGQTELKRYVEAIDSPISNGGWWQWETPSLGWAEVELRPGDVVSLQIAYDPRWKASVAGEQIAIKSDGLGQMVLEPKSLGSQRIRLEFANPIWLLGLSGLAWLGFVVALFRAELWRKEPASLPNSRSVN